MTLKKDFYFSILAGILIGVFSIPTSGSVQNLINPYVISLILLFGTIIGIIIAGFIGKKIPIILQVSKFGVVGILNTLVDIGIINLLSGTFDVYKGGFLIPLNIISFSLATVNSYIWNKYWTFKRNNESGEPTTEKKKYEFLRFITISILGLLINTGVVYILTSINFADLDQKLWLNISKLLATVIAMTWNFVGYKFIVFSKKDDTIKKA